jgi:hypothetical protein
MKTNTFRKVDSQNMIACFTNDDAGYLAWLEAHADGYVLNCYRRPTADYLMLHLASCRTITGEPTRGLSWTKDYAKVGGSSVAELDGWASAKTGAYPSRCSLCSP